MKKGLKIHGDLKQFIVSVPTKAKFSLVWGTRPSLVKGLVPQTKVFPFRV